MTELLLRKLQETHDGHDDHDDHDEDHGEINIKTFKIIMLVCMILCVGFGFIPKAWGRCRNDDYILSFLNSFSAGIFLAMAIVHMMPESAEVYATWAACEGIERPFPLPYVMYFVGYLVILLIDRVLAKAYHAGHDHGPNDKPSESVRPKNFKQAINHAPVNTEMTPVGNSEKNKGEVISISFEKTSNNEDPTKVKALDGENVTVSRTAAIILVLALGAHAFFEGIAFGLQTEVDSAGQLAAGIIIHKTAAAISLGGAFARTGYSIREIALFLAIFSIIAPIGIAIGMSIADSNKIVDVVFLGISGGTFIYVACSEIVVNEFARGKY